MRIVFYTSGVTGAGRLVFGMSIGNALERKGVTCAYTILHTSPVAHLADEFHHIKIPLETETELSKKKFRKSLLFKTLIKLKPDVLLVNHQWYMIFNFIEELKCKKIYLSDNVYDKHFRIPLPDGDLVFKKEHYDLLLAIEPFKSPIPMDKINPLIIRNRDEILPREKALKRLGLDGTKKVALYSFGGNPEDFDRFKEKYAYLDREYEVVQASVFQDGLFPIVDYYNAFDFIVCGAGYNNVWDSVYFKKKAVFETTQMKFCDQSLRVRESKKFRFDINGADQLSDIIMNL